MNVQEENERARLTFEEGLADVKRFAELQAENARLQRGLELSQHDHEVAVEAQRELAMKSVELVEEIARLQERVERLQDELEIARVALQALTPVAEEEHERDALQARVEEAWQGRLDLKAELDGYKALAERRKKALEPFMFCQDVQHKPAEYVTRDMALDAGEPTMEGTMLRGVISEPCGNCDGCRARAAIEEEGI